MSLLPSTNNGASAQNYFIQNIGGAGFTPIDVAPCIKGNTVGAVRIGDPVNGLIVRGDTIANGNLIRGGHASAGSLTIGNSSASASNIVLEDGLTTVNGILSTSGAVVASGGLSVSGDITLLSGFAGDSITGYYTASTAPLNCPDVTDTVIPLPSTLTDGWFIVSCGTAPGGQVEQQVSDMIRLQSGIIVFGGSLRTPAGSGSFGFKLNSAHTGLVLSNSSGAAQNGVTVNFSKVAN